MEVPLVAGLWPLSTTSYVVIALLLWVSYSQSKSWAARKADDEFAKERGCAPAPVWIARMPLGLDFLVQAFWHGYTQTVCEWFTHVSELCASTHEQRLLGTRNIGTSDPENLEAVLTKQFNDFNLGFRIPQFRDLVGSSVLTQEGQDWKQSRELLRPLFSSNRYHGFEDIRRSVEVMLSKIIPGAVTDLQPVFFQLTLETTLFMLFGDSAANMESGVDIGRRAEFSDALSVAEEYLAYRTRVGDFHWLITGPTMWRACKIVHAYVDDAIKEALKLSAGPGGQDNQKPRYVFIDALIEKTRDPKVLRDQCLTLMAGGRDSTAACLGWTMRLLARHPHSLDRLREEISSIVGLGSDAKQPTREDLRRMTYLSCVIKESLRLYPPVPLNQRAATRTTTLPIGGGPNGKSPVMVRQGESVGWCVYAMHRRRDIYGEDAKAFKPERWENNALKNVGYGYLPFGAGPRVCLGQEFAMVEASYTVARLIQWFPYLTVPEGETMEIGAEKQLLTITVSCAEGCRLRFDQTAPA